MAVPQIDEFFATWEIIDHLPNQASGFSATLLKSRLDGKYTLAFRSTEFRDIEFGGDAQRDSVKGAAGDIAFNGMAFTQLSSMEKYWASLLDGTRMTGATPDAPGSGSLANLRVDALREFKNAMGGSTRVNLSGYSLGGHLATMFSVLHGERVASVHLFNASGVGRIADTAPGVTYAQLLRDYDYYMHPDNREATLARAQAWVARAELDLGMLASFVVRSMPLLGIFRPFLPSALTGIAGFVDGLGQQLHPSDIVSFLSREADKQAQKALAKGADDVAIQSNSALSFLVSLFLSESLVGTHGLTLDRMAGRDFPSLQQSGLIPAHVDIYQIAGVPRGGRDSATRFTSLLNATDWNIVADSGMRAARDADLISVYIENQPTWVGWPFGDRGWGDFGTTHSITLIVDSLAVIRMLQTASPELTQAQAETILRSASNLRKEHFSLLPLGALAEHDTLESVVDALGRLLFSRQVVGAIDWSKDAPSADGVDSYGRLVYRDELHQRIKAIEDRLIEADLVGSLNIVPLADVAADAMAQAAKAATDQGAAYRYALKELDPFVALGAPGLHLAYGRDEALTLSDPGTGQGTITQAWIDDRAAFLEHKLRLGMADHAAGIGGDATLYATALGEQVLLFTGNPGATLVDPDAALAPWQRKQLRQALENLAQLGRARKVLFGADGDAAANPATARGGADTLLGAAGDDRLYGEGGNDVLEGLAGDDYLEGGRGDDTLFGGPGSDKLVGGLGYDTYIWRQGDGADVIVDAREPDGVMRGRIVIKTESWDLVPRVFERVENASGVWRSPDRRFVLTQGARWILAFDGGEFDLGADVRNGDFGFEIQAPGPPPTPTVIDAYLADEVLIGPSPLWPKRMIGGYGHDRLYATVQMSLDSFLANADGPASPGWGLWIAAGPGDDLVLGSAADDVIYGGGGRDVLAGGPGNDALLGDEDFIAVDDDTSRWIAREVVAGHYLFDIAPSHDSTTIFPNVYPEQVRQAGDTLYGGSGNDLMHGFGGDDRIFGDDGDDIIIGGEGHDVLVGGAGNDRITGEQYGYAAVPIEIFPGRFVEYLRYVSSYGDDLLDGGEGDDILTGEGGNDTLSGGEGADKLYGDIEGLPGHLHGSDILNGGPGDDEIHGHGHADIAFGGAGNDIIIGDSEVDGAFHGADLIFGEEGNDRIVGAGAADRLYGGSGDDWLIGDAFDLAPQWHGNDVLDGGAGDDLLFGLGGADELFGGDGDDILHGDDPEDPHGGEADLLDGGDGNDKLYGQGGDDRLQGGAGADTLYGEAGDDTLNGGLGPDVLNGGAGNDTYEFRPGDGVDRIEDVAGINTLVFLEGIELSALRASRVRDSGEGTDPLRITYGGSDAIVLDGGIALSSLRLRIGSSDLLSGAELLALSELLGEVVTGTGASEALAAAPGAAADMFGFGGDDLLVGSELDDRLDGGDGDDVLWGLGGNDTLIGGLGADLLVGGAGDDRMAGGADDDVYEFARFEGVDTIVEAPAEGDDVVVFGEGVVPTDIRFRRSGDHLVLVERAGSARIFVRDWLAFEHEADRGIDAVRFESTALDVEAIVARVDTDRTLHGTDAADVIIGDEFDDILIGGAGNDLLAGLHGDDRYVYNRGDGQDRIDERGGFDVIAFGAGIAAGEFDIVGRRDASGELLIEMTLAGDGGQLVFSAAREQRIERFEFEGGDTLDFETLLARAGGLRQEGADGDDVIVGGVHADAIYGHLGDDALSGGAGQDVLVGGPGNDTLAGGAHDDTYYYHAGDGRDVIVEFQGTDEHGVFRSYFTASGQRAFDVDGVTFAALGAVPGPRDEIYHASLGALGGGIDTLVFREGVGPGDIRVGLDLSRPGRPYLGLIEDDAGVFGPSVRLAQQAAYVLEIGEYGDAVEVLWPLSGAWQHANGDALPDVPLERIVFGEDSTDVFSFADLFALAGGWRYVIGSAGDDDIPAGAMATGGVMAGGPGDDRYVGVSGNSLSVVEAPGEGNDTIVFGDGVHAQSMTLAYDQQRMHLDVSGVRVVLDRFAAMQAEQAMIERFEFADGSVLDAASVLSAGVDVPGTGLSEVLLGTSVDDRLRGGAGNDRLTGGPGRDRYLYGPGDGQDVIEERGRPGEDDAIVFLDGISAADVAVRRVGEALVFDVGVVAAAIVVTDWFVTDAMRVERVMFADETSWDAARLAALTGTALDRLQTPAQGEGSPVVPGSPATPDAPADPGASMGDRPAPIETPPANPHPGLPGDPATRSPSEPPTSSGLSAGRDVAAGEDALSASADGAPAPASVAGTVTDGAVVPRPTSMHEAWITTAPIAAEATRRSTRGDGGGEASMSELSTVQPAAADVSLAPLPLGAAVGTLETLAAGGFVSPGRATGVAEDAPGDTASSIEAEAAAAIDAPAESAEDAHLEPPAVRAGDLAMAQYWRRMHARLDAYLERADPDEAESAPGYPRPRLQASSDDPIRMAPSRALGLYERAAFDARPFQGLSEGIARLGF